MKKLNAVYLLFTLFFCGHANATVYVINVQDGHFQPDTIQVQVGDTIRWYKDPQSVEPHTTTSGAIPATAQPWNQDITDSSPTYDYPVTVAGNYNYSSTLALDDSLGMVGYFLATTWPVSVPDILSPNISINGTIINHELSVSLILPEREQVNLTLYNEMGQPVAVFGGGEFDSGLETKTYSVGDLSTGVYYLSAIVGQQRITQRLLIAR